MSIFNNPEQASDLPQIKPNWGERGSYSAEAKSTENGEPVDREDLLKAKVLDQDTKTGDRNVSLENGHVVRITSDQWNSIMNPDPAR